MADSSQLDFETTPVFNLTVTVTDSGGLTDTAAVTVSLTDVNEAPVLNPAGSDTPLDHRGRSGQRRRLGLLDSGLLGDRPRHGCRRGYRDHLAREGQWQLAGPGRRRRLDEGGQCLRQARPAAAGYGQDPLRPGRAERRCGELHLPRLGPDLGRRRSQGRHQRQRRRHGLLYRHRYRLDQRDRRERRAWPGRCRAHRGGGGHGQSVR